MPRVCSFENGGWRWLCLASAFLLPLQVPGQGTIIHFNLNPEVYLMGHPTFPVSYAMDFNGDGQAEFVFTSNGEDFGVTPSRANAVLSYTFGPGGLNAWAYPLPFGYTISSDQPVLTWFERIDTPFGSLRPLIVGYREGAGGTGLFQGVESAYIGLRFDLAGETHFGWARIGSPFVGEGGGYIYEFAYETQPGMPILAGAKPVVVPLASPEIIRSGNLRLRWQSEIGKAYQVQSKDILTAPLWINLGFVVVGTTTNAAVDIPITGTSRFFRVVEAD